MWFDFRQFLCIIVQHKLKTEQISSLFYFYDLSGDALTFLVKLTENALAAFLEQLPVFADRSKTICSFGP